VLSIINLIVFALLAASVLGAATSASVVGANNTQLLVAVTTTYTGDCTYELSENASLTPLVNDINTSHFAGANSDARDGSRIHGNTHLMLIGRRTSEVSADDGKLKSRALAVSTAHHGRVTCGAETALFAGSTTNIPWGNTYPETYPYNSAGVGGYAWPQFNWTDRNEWVIDPLTGVKAKRVSGPGDIGYLAENKAWQYALDRTGSSWTNPSNAIGWTGSGAASAFANTATTDPLFTGSVIGSLAMNGDPFLGTYPKFTIDDVLPLIYGYGTDEDPANREVDVCWTVDSGQTCHTPAIRFSLPQSVAALGTSAADAKFPGPASAINGGPHYAAGAIIPIQAIGPMVGSVTASGAVLSNVGLESSNATSNSNRFQYLWTPGTKIYVANSTCLGFICEIATLTNGKSLTLTGDPGITGTQTWVNANFGLRITKTNATGSVYVSAAWKLAMSRKGRMLQDNGSYPVCGPPDTTTVDINGNPLGYSLTGWPCIINQASDVNSLAGALYFITETGEVRYISPLIAPSTVGSGGDTISTLKVSGVGGFGWDTDPKVIYSLSVSSAPFLVIRTTYSGDWRQLPITYANTQHDAATMSWSIVTKVSEGKDVQAALDAATPYYVSGWQGTIRGVGVSGGHYIGYAMEQQDLPCIVFSIRLSDGVMVKALDSLSGPNGAPADGPPYAGRWGTCHEVRSQGFGGKVMVQMNGAQGLYRSAVIEVDKGAGWVAGNNTAIAHADGASCEAWGVSAQWAAIGATGNNCLRLRLGSEPARSTATAERTAFPCAHDATKACPVAWAEGDQLTGDAEFTEERMRIVKITRNSLTDIEVVVQRRAFCGFAYGNGTDGEVNGWTAYAANTDGCRGSAWWMDVDDPTTGWYADHARIRTSHMDFGPDDRGTITQSPVDGVRRDPVTAPRYGADLDFTIVAANGFASASGYTGSLQGYPSRRQTTEAPILERAWAFDYRHTNGGLGTGPEVAGGPHGSYTVDESAVGGMADVYRITPSWAIDRKRMPLSAWAGRNLLRDISGPASTMTAEQDYTYCIAERANECVAGSSAGFVYINVPFASTNGCYGNQTQTNYPCLIPQIAVANHGYQVLGEQYSPFSANQRAITSSFNGPGMHYVYTSLRSMPNAAFALTHANLLDNLRHEVILLKLPPSPPRDSIKRTTWMPYPVTLPARPGEVAVKFGYLEHGTSSQYHCTTRQEACLAVTSTITEATPFVWEHAVAGSDQTPGLTCTSGCTIPIPAVSGRVLYYEAFDVDTATGALTAIAGTKGIAAMP
jgi:hypothetical protein